MDYGFQKLTPVSDAKIDAYEDALKFIFSDDEIKNIALSGAYGAGKSSVLESYKEKHKDIKFIHVSLAQFSNTSHGTRDTIENGQAVSDDKGLEGKIINQLVHQIGIENIPLTNFQIKREPSRFNILWISIYITVLIVLLLYCFNFAMWKQYLENTGGILTEWLGFTIRDYVPFVAGVVIVFMCFFAFYKGLIYQRNRGWLKKINICDNEIELFNDHEESLFDRYLDEVLYIFKQSKADVIVFEDIDRYESVHIFQQLREINRLVNIKRCQEIHVKQYIARIIQFLSGFIPKLELLITASLKPLKFLYLLRDEMFISKERTKFFDFILPIVPVIDGSNSVDVLVDIFKNYPFDLRFLQEVSLYIDDMRLLKNIANEYAIYSKIMTTEQNPSKMLSIIIYKNIFPKDFSDLQLNKGFVYNLFAQKDYFVEEEKNNIDSKIEALVKENVAIEAAWQKSRDEVEEFFNIKRSQDPYRANAYEIEKQERIKMLQAKQDDKVNLNIDKINELKKEREGLAALPLQEIITRENIESIFQVEYENEIGEKDDFAEIKRSLYFPLIKYLIRNGYIDESYTDYMTYFYANSICREDKIFLRSITDQKKKEYTYTLKEPSKIVAKLSDRDYRQEEILNFDLLDFLLNDVKNANHNKHIHDIMQQIINGKNETFIFQFILRDKNVRSFIKRLNMQWKNVMVHICNSSTITENQKVRYIWETLHVASGDDLFAMNLNNVLSDYISQHSSFLKYRYDDCEEIAKKINSISVKFQHIDEEVTKSELFESIYQRDMYELSFENICVLARKYYDNVSDDMLKYCNYTCVWINKNEQLSKYIGQNMNEYMKVILKSCDGAIYDDSVAVCHLLNNDGIDENLRNEYISYLGSEVSKIDEVVDKSLWSKLLKHGAIKYSCDNVLSYFFEVDLEEKDELFGYLNNHVDEVNSDDWKNAIQLLTEDKQSQLFEAIVVANDLKNRVYFNIIKNFDWYLNDIDSLAMINEDKIDILMRIGSIQMMDDVLAFMRSKYNYKVPTFISQNVKEFSENISPNLINKDEILEAIEKDIVVDDKKKLLKLISGEEISIVDKDYEEPVKEYIVKNNFASNDLRFLIREFEVATPTYREAVVDKLAENIDSVVEGEIELPFEIGRTILSKLDVKNKVVLFTYMLPKCSREQCIQSLELFDDNSELKNLGNLFYGKHPKFSKDTVIKQILNIFEEKNWVTSVKESDDCYIAYGKKYII